MNVENTAKIVGINHQTFRQKMASYKRHPGSLVVLLLTILAAVITAGVLLSLIVYIMVMGVPNIRLSMFAWKYTTENCSMLPSILNTLMMTVLTLVIAVPIGVFSAIYLVEYSNRGSKFQMTLVKIIRMTTETLQGIPSIVFGLFGFLAFAVTCKFSYSLLGGAITMALMVLPLIMRTTEEALLSVPDSYREGSFGLGAGRLRTIFRIILPSAVPGILAGIGLFFVLLHWLGGFLWCMNLELLTVPQQESIRTLLAQSGIWEGCRPSQAELAQAQQLLEASGDFGWVSLNFTGGCLTAEGTPLQQAHAESPAQNTGLYARAGGEVLAVNIASGFAQVQPGQYVGSGMLLAAAEKLDRSGAPVPQPASGTVTARVRLAYTGQQAFTQQRPVLTGACAERRTLTLLGRSWQLPGSGALPEDVPPRVRWLPLRLGRLALPGCVQETTCWARETQEQTFTPETAAALARRSARLQLLQDYPDAVIESEHDFASTTATAAVCRAVFVFCANIAEPRSATAASG